LTTGRRNQQTARSGEFFVAAELNRRGFDAVTFTGNMPGIDAIAVTSRRKTFFIQVKTQRDSGGWQVDVRERARNPTRNMFWVLVLLRKGEEPRYWVIPDGEMRGIIQGQYEARRDQFDGKKITLCRLKDEAVDEWQGGWCRLR
jgi:hypothetical protein